MGKRRKKACVNNEDSNKGMMTTSNVNSDSSSDDLRFSMEYHWYKTVKIKHFNNHLKEIEDLKDEISYIMGVLFPKIHEEWSCIFNSSSQYKHCHAVFLDKDKLMLIDKILKEMDINIDIEEIKSNLWQIGLTQGLRIFGMYYNQTFTPLFIDRYHMIYPSEKHNQRDTQNHTCCIN